MGRGTEVTFKTAAVAFVTALDEKVIAGETIVSRMVSVLKLKKPVKPDQPLAKIAGGDAGVWDLALQLMRYPPFFRDGLELAKREVAKAVSVGDLGELVFASYKRAGWTVR